MNAETMRLAFPKQDVGARYRWRIMEGDPENPKPVTGWSEPKHNLILPPGLGNFNWYGQMTACRVGSGTTPNKVDLDGTYSQTGTTVTRVSGSGVFASGNVNDFIKFGSGEIAKITAFTGTTEVEVDRSQSVAAVSLAVYDASRTALDSLLKTTGTKVSQDGDDIVSLDTDTGITTYTVIFNFATETSEQTYTEAALASTSSGTTITSRVVLESEVTVGVDQFLQMEVSLYLTIRKFRTSEPVTLTVTGWPFPYNIQSIVSNGTYWDITVDVDCDAHYATGRPIIISGALPTQYAISAIASNVSNFTITAAGHTFVMGDDVVIDGATPSGYDGDWTVASVSGDDIVITSGINLGAGSGGTIRLETPATWYDGTHTIASFPDGNIIRVTSAETIVSAGIAGTVKNSLGAVGIYTGSQGGFYQTGSTMAGTTAFIADTIYSSSLSAILYPEASMKTGQVYGGLINTTGALTGSGGSSYDAATRTRTFTLTWSSAQGNSTSIRQVHINSGSTQSVFLVTFDERQRKDEGYLLTLVLTQSWDPDLSE